jgi:chemotaxis protein CheD
MLRKFLRPGEFYATQRPAVVETLVGSCVAVCLYDFKAGFGMMNHYLRDHPPDEAGANVGEFGITATQRIVQAALKIDDNRHHYRASVFGGAAVLKMASGRADIGEANVKVARDVLRAAGIRIVHEEVGGTRGRRVKFNTQTGEIECRFAGDIPRKKRNP